jgi:glycosyltransferase involved in cell wall biosynthesis
MSIRAQSTKLPYEVIIVDSSDDGTKQIVIDKFPEFKLFHFPVRLSVGEARNIGVKKSKGEIVLFLDTDCIVKSTWIDQMYSAIMNYEADGVCGSLENGTVRSISGTVGFYLEFYRFLAYKGKPCSTPYLLGGNSGFRKEIFKFACYKNLSISDDFKFSWQLANQGKNLLFLPFISVRHTNKTGWVKVLRYQYKLGRGAYLYRHDESPSKIRLFESLPILTFLIPFGIILWIILIVLRRRNIFEFLKIVAMSPLLYIGNNIWSLGFYRELMNQKYKQRCTRDAVVKDKH